MNHTPQPAPLSGVKVLELGALIAGPYAASLLAQFGAEVIKVESPKEGDPLRKWRKLHQGTSLWWYTQSRNKKSVTLDLNFEEAREIVRRLVQEVDIVVENFRPGTLEKWGLGWNDLSALKPGLIMVRISGYGQTGPYRNRPGFAAIAECMGGLRYVTGFQDRPPVRVGVSLGDTLASLYGTIGALMAMYHLKVNGGRGQYIDVALYEAVFAVMESLLPEYAASGYVRERSGASLPGISPSNTFVCADGRYVVIAGNADAIFKRLMTAIGRDDLAHIPDSRGMTGESRATTSSMMQSRRGHPGMRLKRSCRFSKRPKCRAGASTPPPTLPPIPNIRRVACSSAITCPTVSRSSSLAWCPSSAPHRDEHAGSVRALANTPKKSWRRSASMPKRLTP